MLFGEAFKGGDAPAVAVMSQGHRQLINFRLHDRMMRIDRIIDQTEAIELKVGVEGGRRLEIRHTDQYRRVACPDDPVCGYLTRWLWKERNVAESH
jgi:hypothetical protein